MYSAQYPSSTCSSKSVPNQKENFFSSLKRPLFTFGILLFVLGFLFNIFGSNIMEYAVKRELVLFGSSRSYSLWIENPVPLFIDYYFFNWTNPSDLRQRGYKPHFQEIGPLRFREHVKKVDVKWNKNGTVTYRKLRTWYFESSGSNGSLDDEITTLNVISLTAARTTKYWNKMARLPLSVTLSTTQNMHVTKKAREFLFEGFSDPLIEFASKVPGLSWRVPFDKFGWFYKRNGSADFDGIFNMETGTNGFSRFGELRFWNYNNHTTFYQDHCGDVSGSAGDFWPPERPKLDDILLFSPDMCRYISFRYKREEMIGGVKGLRYDSGRALFDNGTMDPRNKCFCANQCHPSGTVNVSTCRSGAPAFVSYPHFYLADSFYRNSILGTEPDSRRHDMYIVLEEIWGIPLEVAIRLQINVLIEPDPGIRMYRDVQKTFFPIMWFDQKVTMPEDMLSEMQFLQALPSLKRIIYISLYIVSFFFIIAALFTPRCHHEPFRNKTRNLK